MIKIDSITRKYINSNKWKYDDNTGVIILTAEQFKKSGYTGRSLKAPEIRTIMIPSINGPCLIFEGKHFIIENISDL